MELWTWDHTMGNIVAKCIHLLTSVAPQSPAKTLAKKSVVEFFLKKTLYFKRLRLEAWLRASGLPGRTIPTTVAGPGALRPRLAVSRCCALALQRLGARHKALHGRPKREGSGQTRRLARGGAASMRVRLRACMCACAHTRTFAQWRPQRRRDASAGGGAVDVWAGSARAVPDVLPLPFWGLLPCVDHLCRGHRLRSALCASALALALRCRCSVHRARAGVRGAHRPPALTMPRRQVHRRYLRSAWTRDCATSRGAYGTS